MKKILAGGILFAAFLCSTLMAVVPQKWDLQTKEDFLKGKFNGVSVSSDGVLSLAPGEDRIAGPTEEFYLSVLALADGSVYLGTGHGGKIYRIDRDGKADLYFQAPEMDITCLVLDRQGILFAGSSPNGKIYRIPTKGKGDEFFNPAEKYIWDLAFTDTGNLLAAVGENGGIYEISPQGEGKQVLKTGENHILCMKTTPQGDIIAGSGGGGSVYRLSRDGRAFILFESPYEEIRDLVLDKEGNIYAAASGTPIKVRKEEAAAPSPRSDAEVVISVSAPAAGGASSGDVPTSSASASREPGALYKIDREGVARRLWSSSEEMVYSVAWREESRTILFGTGGKGRIYAVDRDGRASLLLQESSEQAYALSADGTKTYVLGNNPCYLGVLHAEQRLAGEYLSPALDARTLSSWGRIDWAADLGQGATLQILSRSGNSVEPNQTWSDWSPPYQSLSEQILSPKARFLQFKALLKTTSGKATPTLRKVRLFYLQANIAPVVITAAMLKPNDVFLKLPDDDDPILGADPGAADAARKDSAKPPMISKKVERKGFQTVVWDASDENGDALSYKISIRRDGESEWRVLQPAWDDPVYSFDTSAFPDGTYAVKLTASDSPSNPQGTELEAERTATPFVIDNSLPVVKSLTAARTANGLEVSFQAEDAYSSIEEVKCLVRPGEWRVVFPVDGICDSKSESFKFTIKLPAGAENQITIRARDSYGNTGVAKSGF
jgi:sugar lactone lactonase YvrE